MFIKSTTSVFPCFSPLCALYSTFLIDDFTVATKQKVVITKPNYFFAFLADDSFASAFSGAAAADLFLVFLASSSPSSSF